MEPQIPGERKAHALQSRISEDSAGRVRRLASAATHPTTVACHSVPRKNERLAGSSELGDSSAVRSTFSSPVSDEALERGGRTSVIFAVESVDWTLEVDKRQR